MSNTLLARVLLGFIFISLLNACGFQLRGAYQLPASMKTTFISSASANSELTRALTRSLKSSEINVVDNPTDDIAILTLSKESRTKRIVSVDSRGRAREYTLTYAIVFDVENRADQFKIKQQNLSISRDFVFDTNDVLGNSREESQLYNDMQQDLIRLILLRLQSQAENNR